MVGIVTYDARNGLLAEVLEGLRRAHRITLLPKTEKVVALGYWERETGSEGQPEDRLTVAVLRGDSRVWATRQDRAAASPIRDFTEAQQDERWQRLVGLLRPGDILDVIVSERGSVTFAVRGNGFFANFILQPVWQQQPRRRRPAI